MIKFATFKQFVKNHRSFLIFIVLMSIFRSAVADWNQIPSASMEPTILTGDRIWVNKLAYDVQLPFTGIAITQLANPQRGDIVVFNSEALGKRLVKRVIGLPGDKVAMQNNQLFINGEPVEYQPLVAPVNTPAGIKESIEELPNQNHLIRLSQDAHRPYANFPDVLIPEGHYLMLGDNRDNSSDSRVFGFVPREEIIGKATHVVISFDFENYYLPRTDRKFQKLI